MMTLDLAGCGDRGVRFLLVGVGGQGTILASNILAEVGLLLGYDVKKAEVHGMSQRGGSVISHLSWGKQIFSPIIAKGEVDVLIAFETLEALRFVDWLKPDFKSLVLVNEQKIMPITINGGANVYPDRDCIHENFSKVVKDNVIYLDAGKMSSQLGNSKVANVVILGALAALLNIDTALFIEVLKNRVPEKYMALNIKALLLGRQAITLEK